MWGVGCGVWGETTDNEFGSAKSAHSLRSANGNRRNIASPTPVSPNPVTEPNLLHKSLLAGLPFWSAVRGEVAFPCEPDRQKADLQRLQQLFALLGNPLSPSEWSQFCQAFASKLEEGYRDRQWLVFSYETAPPCQAGITGQLSLVTDRPKIHGTWSLPCVPTLIDRYVEQFQKLFAILGQPLSDRERISFGRGLVAELAKGYLASPYSRLIVEYQPASPPRKGLACRAATTIETLAERCDRLAANHDEPFFGRDPDAKAIAVARTLAGNPATTPILDIGAGTGRNTLPLARLGHPMDAIELSGEFVAKLQREADGERLKVRGMVGDILDPQLSLLPQRYQLVVLSEVIPHFNSTEQLRQLMEKLWEAIAPGGWLLLSLFLAAPGYEPDLLAQQMSRVTDSYIFTRSQLAEAIVDLPLEIVSEESVVEYERTHLPPQAWPPTEWVVSWAKGDRLLPLSECVAPIELYWVLCRRGLRSFGGK